MVEKVVVEGRWRERPKCRNGEMHKTGLEVGFSNFLYFIYCGQSKLGLAYFSKFRTSAFSVRIRY